MRLFSFILAFGLFVVSCKQKNQNQYAYNANRDTIAPDIQLTVPVNLDLYAYGEDIHMVGTVTDLESKNNISLKPGRLKSLYLNVSVVNAADSVLKVMYAKWLPVDGKEGYTINEKTNLNSGIGSSLCKLRCLATDHADHVDSTIVYFTIN